MALQHLRSNTASKRPTPGSMSDGQLATNTNATTPGLFFKDAGGALVKVGPVFVGTSAPNSTPAGSTGNALGEQWLDTSGGGYVLKIWDGSAWRSEAGEFVNTTGDTMTGALILPSGTVGAPALGIGSTDNGIYSPGADQVAISTNGTGRLFIASDGSVGLNKSNPGKTLDVVGQFRVRGGDTNAYSLIEYGASATATNNWHVGSEGDGTFRFYNGTLGAGSERLCITSDGNVGVGTSSPTAALHVNSTGAVESLLSGGGTSGDTVLHLKGNGNAYKFIVPNTAAQYGMGLYDVSNAAYRLFVSAAGNVGVGTNGTGLENSRSFVFQTTGAGRATFNHSTTNDTGDDWVVFGYNGTEIGAITQDGITGTIYATSSDYRLKENIELVTDATDRLKALKPYRFNFIADPDRTVDGFLAHEAQEVVPECVTGIKDETDDDGNPIYQGIDQSKLVPLLTAALQELVAEVESLKAEVQALKAQ